MKKRLILLAEDNPEHERLSLTALESAQLFAQIQVARDGDEAAGLLFDRDSVQIPDVAFVEIGLRERGGLDILQRIRSDHRICDMPVVMLGGADDPEVLERSYRSGANSYIQKATDADKFVERLRIAGLYWGLVNVVNRHMS